MKKLLQLSVAAMVIAFAADAAAMDRIAHRGFSGAYPENSLAAITNAWRAGATIVEVDVRISADGIPLLHHDEEIGGRRVNSLTYEQLAALAETPVPSLAAALTRLPETGAMLLDLKDDSPVFLAALTNCIAASGVPADRIIFQSRSLDLLDDVRQAFPGARRFFVTKLRRQGVRQVAPPALPLALTLVKRQIDGVSAKGRRFITKRYVSHFRDRGLSFFVWTINDPDRMAHYRQLGVDGIISDRPDLLRDLGREQGGESGEH